MAEGRPALGPAPFPHPGAASVAVRLNQAADPAVEFKVGPLHGTAISTYDSQTCPALRGFTDLIRRAMRSLLKCAGALTVAISVSILAPSQALPRSRTRGSGLSQRIPRWLDYINVPGTAP